MKTITTKKFSKAILAGYLEPATSSPFYPKQYEFWNGQVTSVAYETTSFAIKVKATPEAQLKHGLTNLDKVAIFSIPWNTDQETVATDLANAISAANSDSNSPLYQVISASPSTGGVFNIEALQPYVNFEIMISHGVQFTPGIKGYDMETDLREAVLKATVRDNSVSYLENGDPASTLNGRLVLAGKSLKISGRENILNARIINVSSPAKVNYTIYVCD